MNKGERRFLHELDVINLLRSLCLSKIMAKIQLTQRQRVLL